ncbi:hypothetical protein [Streptomyces sp. CB03234]|uniref:hypothetical protein n=1 Tax=Streptomyces sp. (strain CB03234) TaxID=1703937 RepID=UPI001180D1C4|nr:hypothetical protein [Streptomyces sp. CB03234]
MTNTAPFLKKGALVAAGVFFLAACTGDGSAQSESSPELNTCRELLGREGVDAARRAVGGGEVRAEAPVSARKLADTMAGEARVRAADGEDLDRRSYEPCRLSGSTADTRVVTRAKWSVLTMDSVSEGKLAVQWREAAKDVYVHETDGGDRVALLVTCQVPEAPASQREGVPLEVEVSRAGAADGDARLPARLALSLAGNLRGLLGCTDTVTVPTALPGQG